MANNAKEMSDEELNDIKRQAVNMHISESQYNKAAAELEIRHNKKMEDAASEQNLKHPVVWWKRPEIVIGLVAIIIAILSIPWWPSFFYLFQAKTTNNNFNDLTWDDAIEIEHAFLFVPRPCEVRLTAATRQDLNPRNILAHIIGENGACEIIDDLADNNGSLLPVPDVDTAPTTTPVGLIVRSDSNYSPGQQVFQYLNGFLTATEGHVMPEGSPQNLIWIEVGDGYPWKR